MAQANLNLGVIQETKVTDGIHTRELAGYHILTADAPSRNFGGVAASYRDTPHFQVEVFQPQGTNVMRF